MAVVALGWMFYQFKSVSPESRNSDWLRPSRMFVALCLLVALLYLLMLMLFPMMFSTEHRRFFYCLPVTAIWLVVFAAACRAWAVRFPGRKFWLDIGLVALVSCNLFALQEHRFVMRHGGFKPQLENAARFAVLLGPTKSVTPASTPSRRQRFSPSRRCRPPFRLC